MVLQVLANAQMNTPAIPNTFRITLLMAFAFTPFPSSSKKKTSHVVTLITYCATNGNDTCKICLLICLLYFKVFNKPYFFFKLVIINTPKTTSIPVHSAITDATAAPLNPMAGKPA